MLSEKDKKIKAMHRLIVIAGPNASGKTALAVRLAKKFNGEIISADSRQVYRGMDIGTGKATRKQRRAVRHHVLGVASPKRQFTVVDFQKHASRAIRDIIKRGKVPFLVGGTGQYIDAVVYGTKLPAVKPDPTLRAKLREKSPRELQRMLEKLDPRRAHTIDPYNPRRVIRALEIVLTTEKPVPPLDKKTPLYDALWLGISLPKVRLYRRIRKRLFQRLKAGMIAEVRCLKKAGVSSKRLEAFGLEYRYLNRYLEGGSVKEKTLEELERAIRHYAKRQITWFKLNLDVHWIHGPGEAKKLVKEFFEKK